MKLPGEVSIADAPSVVLSVDVYWSDSSSRVHGTFTVLHYPFRGDSYLIAHSVLHRHSNGNTPETTEGCSVEHTKFPSDYERADWVVTTAAALRAGFERAFLNMYPGGKIK